MFDSQLLPNLLYLTLVAGLWLAALALVSPGTGILEGLAVLALAAAGLGTVLVPINAWAVLPIAIGLGLFAYSVWGRGRAIWLLASAVVLTVGSAFLFVTESGGPAVNLWLSLAATVLSVGFFWVVVRTTMEAQRAAPTHDPTRVLAMVGEVRTPIDPVGSVYVGGELWTATADSQIPVGSHVRVVDREGLTLVVKPELDS